MCPDLDTADTAGGAARVNNILVEWNGCLGTSSWSLVYHFARLASLWDDPWQKLFLIHHHRDIFDPVQPTQPHSNGEAPPHDTDRERTQCSTDAAQSRASNKTSLSSHLPQHNPSVSFIAFKHIYPMKFHVTLSPVTRYGVLRRRAATCSAAYDCFVL